MLISPADVRRLMKSDDPGSIASQQEVLDILGRPVASEQDIEQLAANLDVPASEPGD